MLRQEPTPPLFGQINSFNRADRLPGSTLPPFSIRELIVQRARGATSLTMMRAPLATPSRLALRGCPPPPIPDRVANTPTPVGHAAIALATMLPWLPAPSR